MAPNMIEIEKTYIPSNDSYIWLCCRQDKSEWVTYLSKEPIPDSTLLGWYTPYENQARKDYKLRISRGF